MEQSKARPLHNLPLVLAGLKIGDVITAVKANDKSATISVENKSVQDVMALIRRPAGTVVVLSIRKPSGEKLNVEIVRELVQMN